MDELSPRWIEPLHPEAVLLHLLSSIVLLGAAGSSVTYVEEQKDNLSYAYSHLEVSLMFDGCF